MTTGLPKTIDSICPECLKVIKATEYIVDNKVMVKKECPEHGVCNDLIFSDAKIYLQMEQWHYGDGRGFENPHVSRCELPKPVRHLQHAHDPHLAGQR